MLRLKLVFLLAVSCQLLSAQDLHVYFDAYTDSVYYMQNGKAIDKPIVRKGSNVMLHIQNYNNYLYKVSVVTPKGSADVAQSKPFSLANLLPAGGSANSLFMGSGSPIAGISLPGLDLTKGSGAGSGEAEMKRQAAIRELKAYETKLSTAYTEMKSLNTEISSIQNKVQTALEAQQVQTLAANEIQNLRYNPNLEPRQIKKLSKEYLKTIFTEEDPSELTLSDVLKKSDAGGELKSLKANYAEKVDAFGSIVDSVQTYVTVISLPKFNFDGSGIENLREKSDAAATTAAANLKSYKTNVKELDTISVKSLDVQTLANLRTTYLTIMENDFSKTYRHTANSDNLNLELVFTPIDPDKVKGIASQKIAPIQLSVYGDLRINASLGVGFGQFFTRPQNYYVRDTFIRSTDKDAFTPFLTSFVHFYRQSKGSASLGGSFGVGIPLGGKNGLENISFFLGPSLVLGRGERIVLSAGLMGGKVDQLTNGDAIGDRFTEDSSKLTTESQYQLGMFVGISFNLMGG
jgi:hypothetical protein